MKRFLITGASRGIGRAIAMKLAASDVTLLLHGRDGAALAETCTAIAPSGASVQKLIHDLATIDGTRDLIAEVGHEPIDLLVNNAGVAVVKPFGEVTIDEWQQMLAVNVTAPVLLTQHFAPRMPPGASIVNVLSVAAKNAFPNWSVYCATKYALHGFSTAVREELREHRVRVLNVYPAATDTDIWTSVPGDWPRHQMIAATEVADAIAFALSQAPNVAIEELTIGSVSGAL